MSGLKAYAIKRGRETKIIDRSKSFEITTYDVDRVLFAVQDLSEIEKDEAIRKGLRSMGNALVTSGKKKLRQRLKTRGGVTGNLYNSFRVRVKRKKPGALAGFDARGKHAHLVDQGTDNRYWKTGKSVGKMPANRFWTDTRLDEWDMAMSRMFAAIYRAKERIIERNS